MEPMLALAHWFQPAGKSPAGVCPISLKKLQPMAPTSLPLLPFPDGTRRRSRELCVCFYSSACEARAACPGADADIKGCRATFTPPPIPTPFLSPLGGWLTCGALLSTGLYFGFMKPRRASRVAFFDRVRGWSPLALCLSLFLSVARATPDASPNIPATQQMGMFV